MNSHALDGLGHPGPGNNLFCHYIYILLPPLRPEFILTSRSSLPPLSPSLPWSSLPRQPVVITHPCDCPLPTSPSLRPIILSSYSLGKTPGTMASWPTILGLPGTRLPRDTGHRCCTWESDRQLRRSTTLKTSARPPTFSVSRAFSSVVPARFWEFFLLLVLHSCPRPSWGPHSCRRSPMVGFGARALPCIC